ncbi:hypothetical protein SAMN05428997_103175 [Bosea sp. CRIB-10]|uniref:DUF937 domain-containing protein n=1 Tax=Bosea sp. CRIB-10 TaxID=378404 RepID=UPI0008EB27B4|nr:DUF937 domain-containing protein [Bosea sp. CRIB-10]SFB97487.1 hypothetical protein SAMN05428997_103175 [Bosea sp. CRIB-10]
MMNLFEMMQSAQNGQAMQNLARQYGLSMQQTQAALDALLPAFTMGLQRQTQNPYAFGNLAQMMTATPFGQMYDSDGDGIPDRAMPLGQDVMSQLFGSKEVANAVAAQAAATSGVGQAILKQMLPVIASIVMGGLFKSVNNQGLGGILGQFAEMMRGQMPGMQPQAQQPNAANPWEQILGGMFGGQRPPAGQAQGGGPFGGGTAGMPDMGNIFGQILGGMFGGAQGQAPQSSPQPAPKSRRPAPEPEPEAQPAGPASPGSIGLDALNQMFEHGRQVQSSQQDALRSIFETMLGGGQRKA